MLVILRPYLYDDVEFGDPSVDFGAAGYSGVQSQVVGTGVAWSCSGRVLSRPVCLVWSFGSDANEDEVWSDDVLAQWMGNRHFLTGEEHCWQSMSPETVKTISLLAIKMVRL